MRICNKCNLDQSEKEYYPIDRTCKTCRKEMVRNNRLKNIDYYREYDKIRYANDPRVKERHKKYAKSEQGKAAHRRNTINDIEKNPEKRAARIQLGNAVRDGRIIKPNICSRCHRTDKIQGHHDDYSKPLEVIWLCAKCHNKLHRGLND